MWVVMSKDVRVAMIAWQGTCTVAVAVRVVVVAGDAVAVVWQAVVFGVVVFEMEERRRRRRLANAALALETCTMGSGPRTGMGMGLVVAVAAVGDSAAPFLERATLRVAAAAVRTAGYRRAQGKHTWPSCRRNRAVKTRLETNTALPPHRQKKRPLDLMTNWKRTMTMTMTMS